MGLFYRDLFKKIETVGFALSSGFHPTYWSPVLLVYLSFWLCTGLVLQNALFLFYVLALSSILVNRCTSVRRIGFLISWGFKPRLSRAPLNQAHVSEFLNSICMIFNWETELQFIESKLAVFFDHRPPSLSLVDCATNINYDLK